MSKPDFTVRNFPPSITTEKVRWLLTYYGIPFADKRMTLSPAFFIHNLLNKPRFGKGPPFTSNPKENLYFKGPQDIIDHFDPLAADDRKLELAEGEADSAELEAINTTGDAINANVRLWGYSYLIQDKALFTGSISAGAPQSQKLFLSLIYPLIKQFTKQKLSPDSKDQEARYQALNEAFDRTDALLADGRKFFFGDRMHFVDIEFCVQAGPCVMPDLYGGGGILPTFDRLPEVMKPLVDGFRQRPTGKFVMEMFANHRLP